MKKDIKKVIKKESNRNKSLNGLKVLTVVNILIAFAMFSLRYVEVINMMKTTDVTSIANSILLMDTVSYTCVFSILIAIYTTIALFRKSRNALLVSTILTIVIGATNLPALVFDYINNPITSLVDLIVIVIAFFGWIIASVVVYEKNKGKIEE